MESQQNSGLSSIAKVGIGCGIVAVLGIIIFAALAFFGVRKAASMAEDFANNPAAAAELIVKMNPKLDHVSTDADAGTMTIRNKETGELVTLNFDDIKQGKFSVQGANGEDVFSIDSDTANNGITINSGENGEIKIGGAADLSDVPSWVPVYPDTLKSTTAMARKTPDGKATGMIAFDVADDISKIIEFYRTALKDQGYDVKENTVNTNGAMSQAVLSATHATDGHKLNILVGQANDKRSLMINYEEQ
ncbi:MAG: hypothetical protein R3F19_03430 [Verrucomicrobiales bacterium]